MICQECVGTGSVEHDGVSKLCPVCDGEPLITFQTVKSYAQQIDIQREIALELRAKISELEARITAARDHAYAALVQILPSDDRIIADHIRSIYSGLGGTRL